jgi:protocatechuate 3,4-dioxygenase alpha subunit
VSYVPTASQTVGPFFNFALTTNAKLGVLEGEGERIRLAFRVVDGDGVPTPGDAMVELWQADTGGFGRLETDRNGCCTFETIKPGRVAAPDGSLQAPHINVIVFARGLLKHLYTRLYFEGDPANDGDLVLGLIPEQRRATLLARQTEAEPPTWRFDIVLQGDGETVFFDL